MLEKCSDKDSDFKALSFQKAVPQNESMALQNRLSYNHGNV